MIFNSKCVEDLVSCWVVTKEPELLEDIMMESLSLAEVIASGFSDDENHRGDLINECMLRLAYCLPRYNSEYSLHKYLTSVFRNTCITYLSKQQKGYQFPMPEPNGHEGTLISITEALVIRNRARFPSISTEVIDSMTHSIMNSLAEGCKPGRDWPGMKRPDVAVITTSSLIWLRSHYSRFADARYHEPEEMSLLPDLIDIFGDDLYRQLRIIFAGATLKIPT